MRRGITESTVYVHNPLPPLSDAEILAKSGLDDTATAASLLPLHMDWQYSFGPESEFIRLMPGDRVALRASDANSMLAELREKGLVSYPLDADEAAIKKAVEAGIKAAIVFFSDRGAKRLTALRKIHNHDRQAMEDNKHENWSFYYAQAVSDLLREHLKVASKPAVTKKAS